MPVAPRFVVLMGVAGCGKTTVGQRLAALLGWRFCDGDDYHPAANRAKMARGESLVDSDRAPWLAHLRRLIDDLAEIDACAVIACSALKARYRDQLMRGRDDVRVVYLQVSKAVLTQRLAAREGHFFPALLLDSQLRALEVPIYVPGAVLTIDAEDAPDLVASAIRRRLRL